MVWALTAISVVLLVFVLVGERTGQHRLIYAFKPPASLAFIGVALAAGALDSRYGGAVLAALVLGAAGDVLLMGRGRKFFLAGLVAFLLSHFAYGMAFLFRGVDDGVLDAIGLVVCIPATGVILWLVPRMEDRKMVGPVILYIAVISAMVGGAIATWAEHPDIRIPIAATLFYVSDITVARERFVATSFVNRILGLPCYYAAQLIFAHTVAG